MAAIDHTARARPQVRNEPSSPPDPFIDQRDPLGLGLEKFDNYTAKLAGTSLAINVLRGLLERSETSKKPNAPRSAQTYWPLNSVQVTGLHAAIYLLQQYVDTLSSEPGG
ncbi:hypothetical protein [Dyella nitratireducens]|uniref:hypothetical protein n=1 Tax=Dyella nitratireducens TaxID=1849580 RepID=UPI00235CE762|nr:hypothetical protein [Dyella nitratireducens]GLQ40733.1 hypothetical protein GCM10007902_05830 [Dyella nitratireducens]